EVPRIVLAVEWGRGSGPAGGEVRWCRQFDEELQHRNVEYQSRRSTGRMGPPVLRALSPGCYSRLREMRVARGAPLAQVKDLVLAVDDAEWRELERADGRDWEEPAEAREC
ncbi:MAG: GH3 auxin-responsive promoter family protein, partial [Myxococcota bacterium]|nr:GH3 auxin-responsive promoter family protein [Myxococcota bacterium]